MKRAVLCVENPQDYIDQLNDYSIMIVNPNVAESRLQYLIDNSDYSVLITKDSWQEQDGSDYANERLFWYTSGTTGDSKFCSFTQEQLDHNAETIKQAYRLTDNDRYTSIMPLWHAHGQGFYWAARRAGCEMSFLTVKDIKQLPVLSPTFITAIPDVLKVIAQFKFEHLRFIRSASAPLPDTVYRALQDQFRVPVVEAFGMTEALSHCFTNPLYGVQRMGTVGLPSGIEADIVDGQLYIRGPSVVEPDWFNTGDLADQDEAGYYRILGRHKDQINVRGMKLNPVSLEQQLRSVLPMGECVLFGSTSVKCLYTGQAQPEDIRQFLLSLGPQCRPSLVEQVKEIPVSPSGKISRTWLDRNY
jgi:acyl-CoA synthetase (AMP-forming)/AMP-acid ligase II